jgi:LmbE family N-acetylglucosaminyl deacetylase
MPFINIVFVVCHPDDEALWVGGLLHGLARFSNIGVYVICLSGQNDLSLRPLEFENARQIAGYKAGVVMGGSLRPAGQLLPSIGQTVSEGLEKLGLLKSDINILITHSPYGEEHMHPHHIQASIELFEWTSIHQIPFGYFSCVPIPTARLQPLLKNMKRFKSMQVLNYALCKYGFLRRLIRLYEKMPWRYPYLYLQWLVDHEAKSRMLKCYQSINLEEHQNGYAMFNNNVESIYLFDRRGVAVFDQLLGCMEVPGADNYFPDTWTDEGFVCRVMKKFVFWKN